MAMSAENLKVLITLLPETVVGLVVNLQLVI
jgi:hypothetical protein